MMRSLGGVEVGGEDADDGPGFGVDVGAGGDRGRGVALEGGADAEASFGGDIAADDGFEFAGGEGAAFGEDVALDRGEIRRRYRA